MAAIEFAFVEDKSKLALINRLPSVTSPSTAPLFLPKEVYWVRGYVNSVIHDLRFGILYIIDKRGTDILEDITHHKVKNNEESYSFIEELFSLRLLTADCRAEGENDIKKIFDRPYKITKAYIELTNICNLRCKHCYNDANTDLKPIITLEDFDYAIHKLHNSTINHICLIGGEPFILPNEDLVYIISKAASVFDKVTVFTNATLMSQTVIEAVSCFKNVEFSIPCYSDSAAIHDEFTGREGSYNNLIKTLLLLDKFNIKYNLTGIYCSGVCETSTQKAKGVGRCDYIRLSGRGSLSFYTPDMLLHRLKNFESLSYEWTKEAIKELYYNRCFSRMIYICPDLKVYPCAMERRVSHGNLKDIDLSNLSSEIVNLSTDKVEECAGCEFRYICSNCPPDSLNGNLFEKPWVCCYSPKTGIWSTKHEKLAVLAPLFNNDRISKDIRNK